MSINHKNNYGDTEVRLWHRNAGDDRNQNRVQRVEMTFVRFVTGNLLDRRSEDVKEEL
jgi:hypothetical protein